VRELQAGLWHWEAPHPEWRHEDWDYQDVSSYAIDDGKRLLLFDSLAVPPEEILEALQPLRELPVELVLPTHGPPVDRAALERALDA
jgi:hypothetical protein